MRLVVLDGYALNPGDLSWEALKSLGECTIYDRTSLEDIVKRAIDADVVLTNKVLLSKETISSLPNLKYIGVLATGYNVVDVDAARLRKIPVTNIPDYGTESVAQIVFAHILNLTQRVEHHANTVRNGVWSNSKDFCYWDFPLIELSGLTLGVVGYGRIGQAVARIGKAFGMTIVAYNPSQVKADRLNGTEINSIENLFSVSDIVSLNCPLNEDNKKFVNAALLSTMKNSSYLINTGRGALIDEAALADALNNGTIAGAGLDVLDGEPPKHDNPLLKAKNCFITPHIAWATRAARNRLLNTAINNIRAFVAKVPVNVVNG
ncbi:MAG: D-2-hydroxyacid dehydrogenase [Fibrobacteres bacterium]|nr:D-2-hydroxyacid dehydrogenase [Fibrobacterota bacterium]